MYRRDKRKAHEGLDKRIKERPKVKPGQHLSLDDVMLFGARAEVDFGIANPDLGRPLCPERLDATRYRPTDPIRKKPFG